MISVTPEYIAIGGNRHPAAGDWDPGDSGLLAFGANNHVAIWNPKVGTSVTQPQVLSSYWRSLIISKDPRTRGIKALLTGHTDLVNCVKFFPVEALHQPVIISGSVDKSIRLWISDPESPTGFKAGGVIAQHEGSVNCIDVLTHSDLFVSGSADASVRTWRLKVHHDTNFDIELLQSISFAPKLIPLCVSLAHLPDSSVVLAVGGTRATVKVLVQQSSIFNEVATLTGHEGWIRSLAFVEESGHADADLVLASASQDKYIRLWRLQKIHERPTSQLQSTIGDNGHGSDPQDVASRFDASLTNKALRFLVNERQYSITFEALLLGHDDWIFTATWTTTNGKLRLLSASADNSLAIWEPDTSSGVWICVTRLGEISAQKGATTATGSIGGFWIGLWSPCGNAVVSLGRTGNWRLWEHDPVKDKWSQKVATGGHIKEVKDVSWAADGAYLLSTSSDQTTRMHAEWKRGGICSWHEFSRPQIHGYDLNCIDSIGTSSFVSGADEKLLRVFEMSRAVATLLESLSGISMSAERFPDAANIPVLGLSNKALSTVEGESSDVNIKDEGKEDEILPSKASNAVTDVHHPPIEDQLARHTLWPEKEKLYGHGYEISAVATSHDGTVVATACRASSIDHAVVRLYETEHWREVKPLSAHSLTVTRLCFSDDDQYLLSVGRDRQWAIFKRQEDLKTQYCLCASNPKGHARMILDGSWAPSKAGRVFATAGRDKCVKLWRLDGESAACQTTLPATTPVTAASFSPYLQSRNIFLAYGTEEGQIFISTVRDTNLAVLSAIAIDSTITPSKSINTIAWRPVQQSGSIEARNDINDAQTLTVASDDASARVYCISQLFDANSTGGLADTNT